MFNVVFAGGFDMASSDERTVQTGFWPKLAGNLARVPFAEEVVAAWYCAFDPATPVKVKGTLIAALAYFILPFDVIPDFLLVLGFTDDLAVLMTAMAMVKGSIRQEHRDKARAKIAELQGKSFSS
jgi:uncharacterized membrane protein YkvA (DUF1232 family)